MDLVYPDPSAVIVVDYLDLKRGPANGDRVVCRCLNREGRHEITLKAYQEDSDGQAWLWPRSRDPRFQRPLALDPGHDPARDPDGEVVVVARVVESHRRE